MYVYSQKIATIKKKWLLLFCLCLLTEVLVVFAASMHMMFLWAPDTLPHMQHDGQFGLSATAVVLLLFVLWPLYEARSGCVARFNQ